MRKNRTGFDMVIIIVVAKYVLNGWLESKTLFCSCGLTLRCDFIELTLAEFVHFGPKNY